MLSEGTLVGSIPVWRSLLPFEPEGWIALENFL